MEKGKSEIGPRAYILKVDGTRVDLNHRPTLKECQEAVGGWITIAKDFLVRHPDKVMYVNEEGLLQQKSPNMRAYEMMGYHIVGDVIVLEGWKSPKD